MVKDVEKDEEKESLSVPNSILLFFSLLVWINNKNTKNAIIISTGTILRNYINIVISNMYKIVKKKKYLTTTEMKLNVITNCYRVQACPACRTRGQ